MVWTLVAACTFRSDPEPAPQVPTQPQSQPEAQEPTAPEPTAQEPTAQEPTAPAPQREPIPPKQTESAFRGWVEPGESHKGMQSFSLDMIEASLAEQLDTKPIVYENLSSIAGEGRNGWIIEGYSLSTSLEDAQRWSVRVTQMGEHYTDCASDGPRPVYSGPVIDEAGAHFVLSEGESWDCREFWLRPRGDLVEVEHCEKTFLARPRESLAERYDAACAAWASAEIGRLKLKTGSSGDRILYKGKEMRCYPAELMGATDGKPRLVCMKDFEEVWFDTDGASKEGHIHNECGWFGIEPEGLLH